MRIQMRMLAILGISMLLLAGMATPALAFNPQPEPPGKPLENALYAVVNVLESVDQRLEAVLATPPDPYTPEFREAVNSVRGAALGIATRAAVPPDPYREMPEVMAALEHVEQAAQDIVDALPPPTWD